MNAPTHLFMHPRCLGWGWSQLAPPKPCMHLQWPSTQLPRSLHLQVGGSVEEVKSHFIKGWQCLSTQLPRSSHLHIGSGK